MTDPQGFIVDTLVKLGYTGGKPCPEYIQQKISRIVFRGTNAKIRYTGGTPTEVVYRVPAMMQVLMAGDDWMLTRFMDGIIPRFTVFHVDWKTETIKWGCPFIDLVGLCTV